MSVSTLYSGSTEYSIYSEYTNTNNLYHVFIDMGIKKKYETHVNVRLLEGVRLIIWGPQYRFHCIHILSDQCGLLLI